MIIHIFRRPIRASIERGYLLFFAQRTTTFYQKNDYSTKSVDRKFTIVEVGPRDGLQNEKNMIQSQDKVALVDKLSACGLSVVEVTSFVSPKWIPQMADHAQVFAKVNKMSGVRYPVLVPNVEGLHNAIQAGVTDIAVFAAASETFSKRNLNCSIDASLARFDAVAKEATKAKLSIRGYVSCVLGCPYEGNIAPANAAKVASYLLDMGCYEVSLGDTIGVGTPGGMSRLLDEMLKMAKPSQIAVHCHDTYGQALANILVAVEKGIRTADSSVAGLGGCPYARGATGNVATEDLLYMLNGLGFDTGVNLDELIDVSEWISTLLKRDSRSKVTLARLAGRLSAVDKKC